ncbi:MAG TPA: histidine phosphatase family protein [Candidatus Dormibacteraeota bacterium]|nr:histidine phosphatase family protein [Candidatus Dormibacteraeota bacterium]
MAETTRIFLCRHAHPANPERVFYGHLPGFGLSELGIRQALGLGEHLAKYPVESFYTSPLQRAQETATLAISRLGREVQVETRDALVEAEFGKYLQGTQQARAVLVKPLVWVHLVRPGLLGNDEPVPALAGRVDSICREALISCRGQAAALVSHADPIKAFWNVYLGRADWRFHALKLPKGGFLELVYDGDELVAVHPHLAIESRNPVAPTLDPSPTI